MALNKLREVFNMFFFIFFHFLPKSTTIGAVTRVLQIMFLDAPETLMLNRELVH